MREVSEVREARVKQQLRNKKFHRGGVETPFFPLLVC
jgi:hypothetical protein